MSSYRQREHRQIRLRCCKCDKELTIPISKRLHIGIYYANFDGKHYDFCNDCYEEFDSQLKLLKDTSITRPEILEDFKTS